MLIYRREKEEIKKLERLKTCTDYSQTIDDYNPTKKRRVLIVFDDMVADMEADKKLSPIVTELFLRGRKLNICFVFIS